MALVQGLGIAITGDVNPSDQISSGMIQRRDSSHTHTSLEKMRTKSEMAMKFLACIIREMNPVFAGEILELWKEYEKGETDTSKLVREISKLETLQQAIGYEERTGKSVADILQLTHEITLPELQSLKDACIHKYNELKERRTTDITIIFISGKICAIVSTELIVAQVVLVSEREHNVLCSRKSLTSLIYQWEICCERKPMIPIRPMVDSLRKA
jgi:hypothetical protein